MTKSSCFPIFLVCSCLWSCGEIENRGIESKEVAQEIKNREIKHITQAQITETAFKDGSFILDTAQQALATTMQEAVQKETLIEAAKYCNLQKIAAIASLQDSYQIAVQRIRLKGRKKSQSLNEMETQLLEAYRYNTENQLPLEKNVQKSGTDYILFTAPFIVNNQVCLKCHGKVSQDLSQEDYNQLKMSYEIDSLVNYSINQPMSILSVMLQRKGIIKRIGTK